MSANPYACHNRQPFGDSQLVQDGWVEHFHDRQSLNNSQPAHNGWWDRPGDRTRTPKMTIIPFRMSPECQYTKTTLGQSDQRCVGCYHRVKTTKESA